MSDQVFTFTIADLLREKWNLTEDLKSNLIHFEGGPIQREKMWQTHNKSNIIIVSNPSAVAKAARSLQTAPIIEQFNIDLFIKVKNTILKAFREAELKRARAKKEIMDIIHDNQTGISGLKITRFGNFLQADEVTNANPITLHNTLIIRGLWFHQKS